MEKQLKQVKVLIPFYVGSEIAPVGSIHEFDADFADDLIKSGAAQEEE